MITNKEKISLEILTRMQNNFNEELEYPELREKLARLLNYSYELGKKEALNKITNQYE